jgi:hypothetical protein
VLESDQRTPASVQTRLIAAEENFMLKQERVKDR